MPAPVVYLHDCDDVLLQLGLNPDLFLGKRGQERTSRIGCGGAVAGGAAGSLHVADLAVQCSLHWPLAL